MRVQRSAMVRYSPAQMYALVSDVESYPRWFDWCAAAELIGRQDNTSRARIALRLAGMQLAFATKNTETPPSRLDLELLEGPFRQLQGHWSFDPIGDIGTKVVLDLQFELSSSLVAGALSLGFRRIADRLVDDFCRTAQRVHG